MWFKKRIKLFIFLTISIIIGMYFSYEPWIQYQKHKNILNQNTIRLRNMEKEWINLKEEQVKYENSFGKEKIARERGFRKDNEQKFSLK